MKFESEEFAVSKKPAVPFNVQDVVWALGLVTTSLCAPPAVAFYMLLVA